MNAEDRIVVDANVVLKWFLHEEHQDQARAVLRQVPRLLAPDLILAEVGNALLKKLRRNETTREAASVVLQQLPGLLSLVGTGPLLETAFAIAVQYQRSFYDSLYVALASRQDCRIVTGDLRLFNALRPHFGDTMLWLGDVPPSPV